MKPIPRKIPFSHSEDEPQSGSSSQGDDSPGEEESGEEESMRALMESTRREMESTLQDTELRARDILKTLSAMNITRTLFNGEGFTFEGYALGDTSRKITLRLGAQDLMALGLQISLMKLMESNSTEVN